MVTQLTRTFITPGSHWSWVIVPVMVLGVDFTIAHNANNVLKTVWEVPHEKEIMDVKVTGHQWWWEFDYLDSGVKVESRALTKEQSGDLYLRDVDNRLVLPTGKKKSVFYILPAMSTTPSGCQNWLSKRMPSRVM